MTKSLLRIEPKACTEIRSEPDAIIIEQTNIPEEHGTESEQMIRIEPSDLSAIIAALQSAQEELKS